jgi:hypothetical protein
MPRKSNRRGAHLDPNYFWSFVDKSGECWLWLGASIATGYGHISVEGRHVLTHRHAWMLENGPIPDGLFVLHRCDNPPCVRPSHLYLGTKRDNALDRERRGRHPRTRGEAHGLAVLTAEQVTKIRARFAAGERQCDLAREYDVNYRTIFAVVRSINWRSLNATA